MTSKANETENGATPTPNKDNKQQLQQGVTKAKAKAEAKLEAKIAKATAVSAAKDTKLGKYFPSFLLKMASRFDFESLYSLRVLSRRHSCLTRVRY